METYFTADLHFECPRIVEDTRTGWTTVQDHDEKLVDNLNNWVSRGDRLVILGDFCGPKASMSKWRQRIKCRNIQFILGNHDKRSKAEVAFGKGRVHDTLLVKLGTSDDRQLVWCSHYPHCHWPHSHYGSYHVYGHCHSQKEAELDRMMPDRRSMDVGVDNSQLLLGSARPFTGYEVINYLRVHYGHGIVEGSYKWFERDYAEAGQ